MVAKEKQEELEKRMLLLGVHEEDLIEKFILGSGSGGQKINKTSSCVYLKHIPSGIEIKCQQERSRDLNRYIARRELCRKIEERDQNIVSEREKLISKIRRQKRKRSKRSKEKMVGEKRTHSAIKKMRKPPETEH